MGWLVGYLVVMCLFIVVSSIVFLTMDDDYYYYERAARKAAARVLVTSPVWPIWLAIGVKKVWEAADLPLPSRKVEDK